VNGCALDQSGGFVITNDFGIWLWDGGERVQLIVDEVEGSKCRMNDCIADPQGRLIAGSSFYNPVKQYDLGKLVCVEADGSVRIMDEGFHLSNGLGFSPDAKTIYFSDSVTRTIFAYDYNVDTGAVRNRRIFVQVPKTSGLPDGLTVDAEGFVWSAEWYGARIVRYGPDGKFARQVEIPAQQTSSLAFGGPSGTDIFVTSAAKSEAMPVMPPGYDPVTGFFGGPLYHLNLAIQGKNEFKTRIGPRQT
ncbi:MAG: SMP-30/gluconolactonase/LRE family protein, partial [Terriglobia bacterium]